MQAMNWSQNYAKEGAFSATEYICHHGKTVIS